MTDPGPLSHDHRSRIADALARPAPDWPIPPLVPGHWQEVDATTALDILEVAGRYAVTGALDYPVPIAHELCRVRMRSMRCYGDALLIEALALVPRIGLVSFIVHPAGVTYLTGRSEPIHWLNAIIPVDLSTSQARGDYFQLFMNWVRGEEGRFQPLGTDTIPIHRDPDAASLARLRGEARPPSILPDPEAKGNWAISARLLYSNVIFQATLQMEPNGMIKMIDDSEVASGLVLRPEQVSGYLLHLAEHSHPNGGQAS